MDWNCMDGKQDEGKGEKLVRSRCTKRVHCIASELRDCGKE